MTLVSCEEESPIASNNDGIYIEDVNSAATVDAIFEDIDEATDLEASVAGARLRIGNPERFSDCVTVTEDATDDSITKTIDFGSDGCEGRDGRVRKGKIVITYGGTRGEVGSFRQITFDGFEIDTIAIAGTRRLEITSISDEEEVRAITLTGGRVTFPDGTTVTRESNRVRTTSLDGDGRGTASTVHGGSEGVNKDGLEYSHTIDASTPLLYTRSCRDIGRLVPVSGILVIAIEGEPDKTVDYGDGTCDNIATVTQDGVRVEIEVESRERRRNRERRQRR